MFPSSSSSCSYSLLSPSRDLDPLRETLRYLVLNYHSINVPNFLNEALLLSEWIRRGELEILHPVLSLTSIVCTAAPAEGCHGYVPPQCVCVCRTRQV